MEPLSVWREAGWSPAGHWQPCCDHEGFQPRMAPTLHVTEPDAPHTWASVAPAKASIQRRVICLLLLQPVGEGPFVTAAESLHPHRQATQTDRAPRARPPGKAKIYHVRRDKQAGRWSKTECGRQTPAWQRVLENTHQVHPERCWRGGNQQNEMESPGVQRRVIRVSTLKFCLENLGCGETAQQLPCMEGFKWLPFLTPAIKY